MLPADKRRSQSRIGLVKLSLVGVGATLAAASLLPFGALAKGALWTAGDAAQYERVSLEYHRLAYAKPGDSGIDQEQLEAQRQRAKRHFELLETKLQEARERPAAWRRYLRWSALLCLTAAAAFHFADG